MTNHKEHEYWVYIMASATGTLYVGTTSELFVRSGRHRVGAMEGFSKTYGCNRLVYYESYDNVHKALSREKQLKGWRRSKKIVLIESKNPRWKDFAEKWGREILVPGQSMKEFEQQTQRRIKLGDKTDVRHPERERKDREDV
ncbi:MAG TPA: GIY-YIG nuclease family protein [Candidatus Angelobacter sp.]|nr:GIY-YIG nuclease family protein [Candidatus Angelobacter sp.]